MLFFPPVGVAGVTDYPLLHCDQSSALGTVVWVLLQPLTAIGTLHWIGSILNLISTSICIWKAATVGTVMRQKSEFYLNECYVLLCGEILLYIPPPPRKKGMKWWKGGAKCS